MKNSKVITQRLNTISFFLLAMISCNTNSSHQETTNKQANTRESTSSVEKITVHCYLYTHEKDSIKLNFTQTGNRVKGTLQFKNYQIDGSSGTINGQYHNDTLWVENDFMAEGMQNNVEEGFLKRGDSLIRGTGTRIQSGDKFIYKDKDSINFEGGQTLLSIECK